MTTEQNNSPTIDGLLKIWWIPQIPMKPFTFPVSSPLMGRSMLTMLGLYDIFQMKNNIKSDYCNAGGLLRYDHRDIENGDPETGWTEWEDENGMNIEEAEL